MRPRLLASKDPSSRSPARAVAVLAVALLALTSCSNSGTGGAEDGEATQIQSETEDEFESEVLAEAEAVPSVDQPSECTIPAAGIGLVDQLFADTYKTVELQDPTVYHAFETTCFYSVDGTASPSTTIYQHRYGNPPSGAPDERMYFEVVQAVDQQSAISALQQTCGPSLQSTEFDDAFICDSNTFFFGSQSLFVHADLAIQGLVYPDTTGNLSEASLSKMAPMIATMHELVS